MKKATAIPSKKARNTSNIPVKDHLRSFECYLKANVTTNPETIEAYLYGVQRLVDHLQGKPLDKITSDDVNEFIVSMKEHYKQNSMINRCAGLRHLMRYLGKDIDVKIPVPLETRTDEHVLTQEEVQQLFHATANDIRDNCILKVLYYSGLRKSELVALNTDDIDFEKKQVIVRNGKGRNNQPEIINLSDEALQSIKAYTQVRIAKDTKALFTTDFGTRLTIHGIPHLIDKALRKTTIRKHVTAHTFRASLITHMNQMGANTFHIQSQSRHRTLVALKRYIRPNEKQRLQSYEAYVPNISNTGITAKESKPEPKPEPQEKPESQKPLPKPQNDQMVGNLDDKIRLLQLENENLRLKLANKSTEKNNNTDTYFQ